MKKNKYNIGKNWLQTFELMAKKPAVLMPFIVIAFFEALALEFIGFATRGPLAIAFNPIIKKFFGDMFIHYPGNIIVMGTLFYYSQLAIFISVGAALTAVSVNIFNNIKEGLPVKAIAVIRNAMKNYASYILYAIAVVAILFIVDKADNFVIKHLIGVLSKIGPLAKPLVLFLVNKSVIFFSNVLIYVFIVLTIPIIVINKANVFKALLTSIITGIKNIRTLLLLLILPFIIYFPITILKGLSGQLADKFSPELSIVVTAAGIILSIFCDSFMILSASQFLLDKKGAKEKNI